MVIVDIAKSIISSFIIRRKRISTLLDKIDCILVRVDGIESFGHTLTRFDKEIAIIKNSIQMIMSFMQIEDRRKIDKKVKKERRK